MAAAIGTGSAFNPWLNPSNQRGVMATAAAGGGGGGGGNAYGSAPLPIPMPSSLWSEVMGANPGLGSLGGPAASAIGSEISGTLSPGTINQLQNKAAAFGVNAGMPGLQPGSLALNNLLDQIGTTSEALTQSGIGNYGSILGTTANTQLDPALQADVGEWNSIVNSAPDPQAAALTQEGLLSKYLTALQAPQGGYGAFGGGTGNQAPPGSTNYQNILNSLGPGTHPIGGGEFATPYYG